jgi:type IV pilus assembly protein PilA
MKKNVQKGFTLIELMIVVAIIAILAAIAIPAYQNYITKSQFSESQTIAAGIETQAGIYYGGHGICPKFDGTSAGFPTAPESYAGKYVAKAEIAANSASNGMCTITLTFKGEGSVSKPLTDKEAKFEGTIVGGNTIWKCSASTVDDKYLPQACQSK